MRSFVTCTVLASVASLASAHVAARQPTFEYPEGVPAVEKRQDPGTPRYLCHENCGTLITISRTENYCDTTEWTTRYSACMECANEFGIWMYYSSGVTNAAKVCGLTPVPSPSGGASTPSSTSAPAAVTTTEAPAPPIVDPSTTAAGATTTEATPASSSAASSAASAASSAASAATSAATTAAAGSSSATVTRVTSIGTSVVIVCVAWAWSSLI
ncbi:hypothetical protein CPLU01_14960 [Colletotrichum plurivorum]|uniref:Dynactin arp1 p25 subunit n=1 Tax=Colletotrichum plurivorum TaxID=2175906 RepID=A0A8H6JFR6_9PEZI|nr:hypothetical protein CPLU01_14960 [Colletotrichum plurivorum]